MMYNTFIRPVKWQGSHATLNAVATFISTIEGIMKSNKQRILKILGYMKTRCYNRNASNYERYGALGVSICDEWINDKNKFLAWSLENGYKEGLTIDRINSKGNYEPDNCRWVDYYVQNKNKKIQKNNTSGYTGVSYDKSRNKYFAFITIEKKKKTIGRYFTTKEALNARNKYIEDNNLAHSIQEYVNA